VQRLIHFVSRGALDIEGMGEKTIQEFFDLGWLESPADIFRLRNRRADILSRDGWQDKSVDNLLAAIEAKRAPDGAKLLFGLGIRHIGTVTARDLFKAFGSVEEIGKVGLRLAKADESAIADVTAIDGVGGAVAEAPHARRPRGEGLGVELLGAVHPVDPHLGAELVVGRGEAGLREDGGAGGAPVGEVELAEADAALEVGADFLDLLVKSAEGGHLAIEHRNPTADDTGVRLAVHLAVGDEATGGLALVDLEDPLHPEIPEIPEILYHPSIHFHLVGQLHLLFL
jgi:hypothetical protein